MCFETSIVLAIDTMYLKLGQKQTILEKSPDFIEKRNHKTNIYMYFKVRERTRKILK